MPWIRNLKGALLAFGCSIAISGCNSGDITSAEVTTAAKERVAASLGLSPDAALFSNVFVGQPVDGDAVLCGTVEGRRADGTIIPPRRFIAAADPERWIRFDRAGQMADVPLNMAGDWATICAGENEVR
ncbi:hypothetical protein ABVV53_10190 [Novosphingobium sp. RD2P27]|uniref:Lipoprotein n=1 Tax=Novosphingobium kalidii TaxID=3230299 RepID=A0ABV2D2F4_9SPHN